MNQKKKQEYSREVKDPNTENQGYCSAHDNHLMVIIKSKDQLLTLAWKVYARPLLD